MCTGLASSVVQLDAVALGTWVCVSCALIDFCGSFRKLEFQRLGGVGIRRFRPRGVTKTTLSGDRTT